MIFAPLLFNGHMTTSTSFYHCPLVPLDSECAMLSWSSTWFWALIQPSFLDGVYPQCCCSDWFIPYIVFATCLLLSQILHIFHYLSLSWLQRVFNFLCDSICVFYPLCLYDCDRSSKNMVQTHTLSSYLFRAMIFY